MSIDTSWIVCIFQRARPPYVAFSIYSLYIARFGAFSFLQKHLQIKNLIAILCISLNSTVGSSMLKKIKLNEMLHINIQPL